MRKIERKKRNSPLVALFYKRAMHQKIFCQVRKSTMKSITSSLEICFCRSHTRMYASVQKLPSHAGLFMQSLLLITTWAHNRTIKVKKNCLIREIYTLRSHASLFLSHIKNLLFPISPSLKYVQTNGKSLASRSRDCSTFLCVCMCMCVCLYVYFHIFLFYG